MPSYRFHCKNSKCGADFHRYFKVEEFDGQQYGSGWACFRCGFPRMAVIKSNKDVKDSFQPGLQKSINVYCRTYKQYKDELKKRGLIELGYDDLKVDENDRPMYWDDETLKNVYDTGIDLSGNEIDALKKGKIRDDDSILVAD